MANRIWNAGILLLLLLLAALLLQFVRASSAIGDLFPSGGTSGTASIRKQIALIAQERDNPFWRSIEEGAREAAETAGAELVYMGPARIDPSEQIRLLKKAIASKYDAIVLQGLGGQTEFRQLIVEAAAQDIPVLVLDTDEPGSKRLAYVGTDNLAAGALMGELIAQRTGGQGRIGVLIGSETAANQQLRLAGLRKAIGAYPGLSVQAVRATAISRLQAQREAERMLAAGDKLDVLVGFSALDGEGMMAAAERLGRTDALLLAFDDLPATRAGIADGRIAASVVQLPREMGAQAIALLRRHWAGEDVDGEHYTKVYTLDSLNVDSLPEAR
ncbi:substrate-binding domain-containing protein [Paenibacillus methanolicus]|uniref:Ribose transport system substrate-binding protein n=1 Tax=Paenibacillus methanolicus TaxID=582686 RepID=A0A5S5BT79_9BACL|nr:substrate-binding domain-containing protein [Paenibacillus methanolicus]TYP70217.1 ribose transport system substrate-binding protein [Paenibacillus methanolicus]